MIVSVLLPTWRRPESLLRCIRSIVDTSADKHLIEFVIRIHREDEATLAIIPVLLKLSTVKIVISLSYDGYISLGRFYDECAALAVGSFVWVMNDDVVVSGNWWDRKLQREPLDGFIIMPQYHNLGSSRYEKDLSTPFMFVPNGCWRKFGMLKFGTPFDLSLWTLLRENGWKTRFIEGLSVWHDRKPDVELEKERNPKLRQ